MSKKREFKFSISLAPKEMTREEMAELLDSFIAQLQEAKAMLLSGDTTKFLVQLGRSKRKPLGRESREKIAAAQRARWMRVKRAKDMNIPKGTPSPDE